MLLFHILGLPTTKGLLNIPEREEPEVQALLRQEEIRNDKEYLRLLESFTTCSG